MIQYFGVFLRLVAPAGAPVLPRPADLYEWGTIPAALLHDRAAADDWGETFVNSAETKMEFEVRPVGLVITVR